jgi:rfaE bifunctional protein nucleotidyltransferase chain/domain
LGIVASQSELILAETEWKRNEKRIVFVSGTFDLLHPGHVRLLEQARAAGDVLVVGVRGDAAERAAKSGAGRRENAPPLPITPAAERAEILAALAAVDCAAIFESPEPDELLSALRPDVVVKGAPEMAHAPKSGRAPSTGPSVVYIPREPGYSSGRLFERIRQLRA